MLAQTDNRFRTRARFVTLLCIAGALISCAKDPQPLVSDPSVTGQESALPWNQQTKWERQGQFAGGFSDQQGR